MWYVGPIYHMPYDGYWGTGPVYRGLGTVAWCRGPGIMGLWARMYIPISPIFLLCTITSGLRTVRRALVYQCTSALVRRI